jgi:hypothetical protein
MTEKKRRAAGMRPRGASNQHGKAKSESRDSSFDLTFENPLQSRLLKREEAGNQKFHPMPKEANNL